MHSPPIGVIFPAEGGSVDFFRLRFCVGSPTVFSRGLGSAPAAVGHTPKFVFSDFRPSSLDRSLVGQVCVARTWLRVDLRDSSGRQARERFLHQVFHCVLTGTQWRTGRIGHTSCCANSLLPDSKPSRWKTSCGSSLRRPLAASALIQEVLLEKGIPRSTFTNRPCRPVLTSVRAFSSLF